MDYIFADGADSDASTDDGAVAVWLKGHLYSARVSLEPWRSFDKSFNQQNAFRASVGITVSSFTRSCSFDQQNAFRASVGITVSSFTRNL